MSTTCAGDRSILRQTDAPSSTTVAAMAPASTQTEQELWSVLPVAALHSTYLDQPHLPIHPGSTLESCDSSTRSHVGRVPNSSITWDLHPRPTGLRIMAD